MNRADDGSRLRGAVARIACGDLDALEDVWKMLSRPLHNYAYALTGSQEEADDVLGDVMVRLAGQGKRLLAVREPKAYLYASVRNAALSWRRRLRWRGGAEAEAATGDGVEAAAAAVAIRHAVMALPVAQREVVVLHVWGGLTFADAGRVAGVSANTAASRYRYALEKLREALGDE